MAIDSNIPNTSDKRKDAIISKNFQEIRNNQKTDLKKDQDGVPHILIGYQEGGFGTGENHGIKVSQLGVDVRDATDDQLVMSSAFNMFKIVMTGTASVTKASGSTDNYVRVNHNLGYIPAHESYANVGGNSKLPYIFPDFTTGVIGIAIYVGAVTSTYIDFYIITPTDGGWESTELPCTIKYYLMRETAN